MKPLNLANARMRKTLIRVEPYMREVKEYALGLLAEARAGEAAGDPRYDGMTADVGLLLGDIDLAQVKLRKVIEMLAPDKTEDE